MLEMTQAEYARHRGVSKQAVNKLVKAGKIPVNTDAKGRATIDAAAADRALGEVRERVVARDQTPALALEGGSLTNAKTQTEVYKARLAQLEYEERVGRLVRIEDVTRSMELCAEVIVRDIDRLPARSDDLAAAFTRGGLPAVRMALKEIARDIRVTLEANMRMLGSDPEPATEEMVAS